MKSLTSDVNKNDNLKTIQIFDFITSPDEVESIDEQKEILSNVKELLTSCGRIEIIKICRSLPFDIHYVSVTFSDDSSATAAVASMDKLVFGGQAISVYLTCGDDPVHYSPPKVEEVVPSTPLIETEHLSNHLLCIEKLLSPNDVVDPEETMEILHDICSLCQPFGGVRKVWIEKKPTDQSSLSFTSQQREEIVQQQVSQLPWAFIEFTNLDSAISSVIGLNGKVIGGNVVEAHLYGSKAYHSNLLDNNFIFSIDNNSFAIKLIDFVDVSQMNSEEEREEITNDILTILLEHGIASDDINRFLFVTSDSNGYIDVVLSLRSLGDCIKLSTGLGNKIIGGLSLQIEVVVIRSSSSDAPNDCINILHAVKGFDLNLLPSHIQLVELSTGVVVVKNYFSWEDLEGPADEVASIKLDLIHLCSPSDSEIRRIRTSAELSTRSDETSHQSISVLTDAIDYIAVIDFNSLSCAQNALCSLDMSIVGGVCIEVYIRSPRDGDPSERNDRGGSVFEELSLSNDQPCVTTITSAAIEEFGVTITDDRQQERYVCFYSEQFPISDDLEECNPTSPTIGSKYREAKSLPRTPSHSIASKDNIPVSYLVLIIFITHLM